MERLLYIVNVVLIPVYLIFSIFTAFLTLIGFYEHDNALVVIRISVIILSPFVSSLCILLYRSTILGAAIGNTVKMWILLIPLSLPLFIILTAPNVLRSA